MSINLYAYEYPEPLGHIGIAEKDGSIYRVLFNFRLKGTSWKDIYRMFSIDINYLGQNLDVCETDVLKRAAKQIAEYLDGKRAAFDLPLTYTEYSFTKQVYDELLKIPVGQTRSYRDIADACGNPKAFRAVGSINNKNPIPIIIPCHRVVGSDGNLKGYAGGLPLKRYLLDLEKAYYA